MTFNNLSIQRGMNPDVYARMYAQQNGISFKEAQTELRTQYGEPTRANDASIGNFLNGSFAIRGTSSGVDSFENSLQSSDAILEKYMNETGKNESDAKADLESKYGKPQENQTMGISSVIGEYLNIFMNFLHSIGGDNGPQNEGDPNPFGSGMQGPTKAGDPDPKQDDPDVAAQKYADENGISLEEAKEKLKELYGDPEQRQ